MFTMDVAAKDNLAILGWFPRSRCWFTMVWDGDVWISFGSDAWHDFYGEQPIGWEYLPEPPTTGEG